MLSILALSGLRAARSGVVVPALSRQARCYGIGGHMSDNNPEILEKEKEKHLKGKTVSQIKEVPGWSAHLASDAEAVVKAERESADCSVEEMQKQTVDVLKEEAEADEEHARTKTGTA